MQTLQDIKQLAAYYLSKAGGIMNGSIFPDVTETLDLGSTTKKWNNVHVKNLYATNITGTASSDTVDTFHASATPTANTLLPLDANIKYPVSVLPNADAQYKILVSGATPFAPAYTALSTFAGAGLSWGTGVFDIGAGTLITVGADSVGVSNGSAQYQVPVTGSTPFTPSYTLLSSFAGDGIQWSTNVYSLELSATSGLSLAGSTPAKTLEIADTIAGSGLSITNKILAVGAGTLITVGADTVGVSNGTAQYQVPVTGATPFTPAWTALSTYAGAGLTWSNNMYEVGQGNGITVNANDVALTTPGTLTVSTTNSASGSHTHAITSSSAPGANARILASDASGYLQLVRLGVGVSPSYLLHAQGTAEQLRLAYDASNYASFTVGSGGNITIAPTGDLILDPVGNDVLPNTTYDLNLGAMNKKYLTLYAAELWVETLVAQNTIATIGGRILVGPTTTLTADLANTAPNQQSVTFRASTTAQTTADATSLACNVPAGSIAGDLMITAIALASTTTTITVPSGWTLLRKVDNLGTNASLHVYYHLVTGTEPSDYTWTISVSGPITISCITVYGDDVLNVWDAEAGYQNASGTTCTVGAINTTTANTLMVWIAMSNHATLAQTFTTPSGLTNRTTNNNTGSTSIQTISIKTGAFVGPGSTGNKDSTMGNTAYSVADFITVRRQPATATMQTKHNEMIIGDTVYAEVSGSVEFMQVMSGPTGAGPYSYEVSRNIDGSGINSWNTGDAIFNTGQTGDGFIDIYSINGIKSGLYGPTIAGNARASTTYNGWNEHWAIGNLNGLYGYSATTYGAAFGKYADGSSFITVDATNGIRFQKRASSTNTVTASWDTSGNITLGEVGAAKSNVYLSAGGIQLRTNTTVHIDLQSDGDVLLGENTSAAATTNLAIFTTAQTYNTESVEAGDLLLGDNSSSKANIFWDKSAGILNFRTAKVAYLWLDTAGALVAGSSGSARVKLNADGMYLYGDTNTADYTKIKWVSSWSGTPFATIQGYDYIEQVLSLTVSKTSGAPVIILTSNDGTNSSRMSMWASGIEVTPFISFYEQASNPSIFGNTTAIFSKSNGQLYMIDPNGNVGNLTYNRRFPKGPSMADSYPTSIREFGANAFTSHIADFTDSQSSPYSFGASPGGFSVNVPTNFSASSTSPRHHLQLSDSNASSSGYLQWTDATGKGTCDIDFSFASMGGNTGTDAIRMEIRMWGVQSPSGTDKYYALRFKSSDKGMFIHAYYGTGTTLSATDGTQASVNHLDSGTKWRLHITLYNTPAYYFDWYSIDEGAYYSLLDSGAPGAGYPGIIKTLRFYIYQGSYCKAYIDRIAFA